MTETEKKIAQRLNDSIERIVPNELDALLSDTSSRIVTGKRRFNLKLGIAVLSFCVAVTACGIAIYQMNAGKRADLTEYKQKIQSPHCELYFNEEKNIPGISGFNMPKPKPLYSMSDIINLLGYDPLKNVWIPSGLKNMFATKNGDNSNSDRAYIYYKRSLDSLTICYSAYPNNSSSKSIDFVLSHNNPHYADFEPAGKTKISYIYRTKVILAHHPANANEKNKIDPYRGKEIFCAKFSYRGVGYSIFAQNGFTQKEFIKVLTSIIKS